MVPYQFRLPGWLGAGLLSSGQDVNKLLLIFRLHGWLGSVEPGEPGNPALLTLSRRQELEVLLIQIQAGLLSFGRDVNKLLLIFRLPGLSGSMEPVPEGGVPEPCPPHPAQETGAGGYSHSDTGGDPVLRTRCK
jgi:hypothetical protein